MAKFYKVLFEENDDLGIGCLAAEPAEHPCFRPVGDGKHFFLPYSGVVRDWRELHLQLRDGAFPDYLASNLGCRICSSGLKGILNQNASNDDTLQWLPITVEKNGEKRSYYVLHFPSPPDVLDRRKSIFAGGDFVVKPVISEMSAKNHRVFSYPLAGDLPLLVFEDVKCAIEAAGCTGMEFSKLATSKE